MIGNILSRTLCLLCSCALFLNIYHKINFMVKIMGLTYAISIVNWIFGNFLLKNIFLLFFTDFKLLMFHNNIVKISEILNK